MKERSFDEMIAFINRKVSDMDISQNYKMELIGMLAALGYKYEKSVPQWIPCSERLSEESGRYLVTPDCIYNAVRIDYFRPEFGWEDGEKYTAWMPLPEPYKAKEEL